MGKTKWIILAFLVIGLLVANTAMATASESVEILGSRVYNIGDGKRETTNIYLIVKVQWTNTTGEATNFAKTHKVYAYQDGISLSQSDAPPMSGHTHTTEIKAGKTITIEFAFRLKDFTTAAEAEVVSRTNGKTVASKTFLTPYR